MEQKKYTRWQKLTDPKINYAHYLKKKNIKSIILILNQFIIYLCILLIYS